MKGTVVDKYTSRDCGWEGGRELPFAASLHPPPVSPAAPAPLPPLLPPPPPSLPYSTSIAVAKGTLKTSDAVFLFGRVYGNRLENESGKQRLADILKRKKLGYMIFPPQRKKNAVRVPLNREKKNKGLIMHHSSRLVKVKPHSRALL